MSAKTLALETAALNICSAVEPHSIVGPNVNRSLDPVLGSPTSPLLHRVARTLIRQPSKTMPARLSHLPPFSIDATKPQAPILMTHRAQRSMVRRSQHHAAQSSKSSVKLTVPAVTSGGLAMDFM